MHDARFKAIHLVEEMIAEFEYRPTKCKKDYRVIVLRKKLGIDEGQMRLFEEYRYFFPSPMIVRGQPRRSCSSANDRCDQEEPDRARSRGGVHAATTPVENDLPA